jgi:hypothetical protein
MSRSKRCAVCETAPAPCLSLPIRLLIRRHSTRSRSLVTEGGNGGSRTRVQKRSETSTTNVSSCCYVARFTKRRLPGHVPTVSSERRSETPDSPNPCTFSALRAASPKGREARSLAPQAATAKPLSLAFVSSRQDLRGHLDPRFALHHFSVPVETGAFPNFTRALDRDRTDQNLSTKQGPHH